MTEQTTNWMRRRLGRLATALLIALGTVSIAQAQDQITLRGSVRLDASRLQVRLSDVADLKGDVATALGDQVVFQSGSLPTRPVTVNLDTVRQRLDEAGANLGLLAISGRECVIRWRSDVGAPSEQPTASAVDAPVFASQFIGEPTIRGVVSDYLARILLHRDPADVQLEFRSSDTDELKTSAAGYEYEIKPLASKLSSTIPLLVNVYSGSTVVRTIRLTVEVGIRQRVVVVQRYVGGGEVLKPGDAIEDVRITAPHLTSHPERVADLLGQEAHGRLVPGQILEDGDVVSKVTVDRNAEVWVRARHGMFVIRMRGRAMDEGRVGDVIRVQRLNDHVMLTGMVGADGEIVIDTGVADSTEVSR